MFLLIEISKFYKVTVFSISTEHATKILLIEQYVKFEDTVNGYVVGNTTNIVVPNFTLTRVLVTFMRISVVEPHKLFNF